MRVGCSQQMVILTSKYWKQQISSLFFVCKQQYAYLQAVMYSQLFLHFQSLHYAKQRHVVVLLGVILWTIMLESQQIKATLTRFWL